MTLNTILRFSRAATAEEMFTGQWQSRATRLDDYKPYLDQRWQEGCTNAWKLWEEIREQGYPRGYASVRAYVSRTLRGKIPDRQRDGRQQPAGCLEAPCRRCSLLHGYGPPKPSKVYGQDLLLTRDPAAFALDTTAPGRTLVSGPVFCRRLAERIAAEAPDDWDNS
jgi:hypothetical protein